MQLHSRSLVLLCRSINLLLCNFVVSMCLFLDTIIFVFFFFFFFQAEDGIRDLIVTGVQTCALPISGPGSAGYRVTVSSTTDVGGSASTVVPVYTFYPNGTIGYPIPPVSGVPVAGTDIRWPDAVALASGKIYRSKLQIQGHTVNVTVQGTGTRSVSVPARTYRASVVLTTIYTHGQ